MQIGWKALALGIIAALGALAYPAAARDKVKGGVYPTASSLPHFIAIERGFFKEQNIEPETIRLIGGPSNITAMISNQIEAAVGSDGQAQGRVPEIIDFSTSVGTLPKKVDITNYLQVFERCAIGQEMGSLWC
jgi:ABC-type nitrate/sulfonate/bicarbonate transport system substrate-binding protein